MKKHIFLSAALLLLTASCSNTDENNEQKEPTQTVQFSFTNEDFGEDETPSRATSAAEAKPQTIDLGDCEAEITVENEPAVKKTRGAQTPATGHYTIRAYQGGTLKGEIKGTFNGGKFSPDASSKRGIILPHGTYDFVAFNDQVTISGNELKVDRADVETARMGTVTVVINQDPRQLVTFTMKHVGCRLRTQFVCQKDIPNNITATLEATAANVIPASVTYNPATKAYTATNGAMAAISNNSPASTEAKYTTSNYGQNYFYTSTADYHYFLPTTAGSKLKLTGFSAGTVFWKPLTGSIPQLNATLSMEANKSYLVKIKLKPSYTYLMSDGDTGSFKDTTFGGGSKTPIAVVVNQNKRLAISLKMADNGNEHRWCDFGVQHNQSNSTVIAPSNLIAMYNDIDGYKYTWEPSGSFDGSTIKANEQTNYPAFYQAGHYTPTLPTGVNLSGTIVGKKWYLPSTGEWIEVFKNLGFGDISGLTKYPHYLYWYGRLADSPFKKVGGEDITYYNAHTYHSSSEKASSTQDGWILVTEYFMAWRTDSKPTFNLVRPFITY